MRAWLVLCWNTGRSSSYPHTLCVPGWALSLRGITLTSPCDSEASIHGIKQIPNTRRFPNEGTLNIRQSDLATVNTLQEAV